MLVKKRSWLQLEDMLAIRIGNYNRQEVILELILILDDEEVIVVVQEALDEEDTGPPMSNTIGNLYNYGTI
ncbi:7895_t:CDS:2 [Entrophospora sp. SA101]|nr:7895_t:CDS:2 [Entrophospora sp. SA101]